MHDLLAFVTLFIGPVTAGVPLSLWHPANTSATVFTTESGFRCDTSNPTPSDLVDPVDA